MGSVGRFLGPILDQSRGRTRGSWTNPDRTREHRNARFSAGFAALVTALTSVFFTLSRRLLQFCSTSSQAPALSRDIAVHLDRGARELVRDGGRPECPHRGVRRRGAAAMHGGDEGWFDRELVGCRFPDERLQKRLRTLAAQLGSAMGQSIPLVCQDWANTKAAYRFFSNERVSEADILAGHFQSTRDRAGAIDGLVLMLHDTTEFSYQREKSEAIGITKSINSGRDKPGRLRSHTVCGILMHSSLAVTIAGVPLGLAAVKFWTRKKFKGTAALKKKINPTRIPIEKKESIRWLENLKQSTEL